MVPFALLRTAVVWLLFDKLFRPILCGLFAKHVWRGLGRHDIRRESWLTLSMFCRGKSTDKMLLALELDCSGQSCY